MGERQFDLFSISMHVLRYAMLPSINCCQSRSGVSIRSWLRRHTILANGCNEQGTLFFSLDVQLTAVVIPVDQRRLPPVHLPASRFPCATASVAE